MSQRILLIDYDPHSIGRIRGLLRGGGYEIHIAKDGIAGIESFRRLEPRLTLVQDLLPKKAGEEVCQVLKDIAYGKEGPVVVLIVAACKKPKPGGDSPWCDEIIVSPFTDDTLLCLVRKYLGNGSGEAASGSLPGEADDADVSSKLDSILGGPEPEDPV